MTDNNARDRDSIAWSIRDMAMLSIVDEEPSAAAKAILAALRDRAPPRLRSAIDKHGLACLTIVSTERAALAAALESASQDMARAMLASLADRNGVRSAETGLRAVRLPQKAQRACMALKTRLAAFF